MPDNISIAGYEFVEKLGAGSAGAVYKARQISMDRMVAIKILPGNLAADARFIERFYSEARAVAKLNHPNIVTGIDVGESNGLYYFVMEYVDGDTLAHRLTSGGAVDETEALEITRQIALALDHAYRNGIIHRDIKPANVLMMQNGIAKLADLGVAKQAGGEGGATGGRVFGTPYYMSPEQARAEIDIDIRSDVYSLGATLYHLLCGQPPFHGNPPAVVMAKQIAEEPEDVRKVNPEVSRAAADLVNHMISKKPEDRPETPEDLVEAIKRAQKGKPHAKPHAKGHHQPGGTAARARRATGEREIIVPRSYSGLSMAVAVGGLLLLAVGIVAVLLGGGDGDAKAPGKVVAPVGPVPTTPTVSAPVAHAETGDGTETPVVKAPPTKDREGAAADAFAALAKKKLYPKQELASLRDLTALYADTEAAKNAKERVAELAEQLRTLDENRNIRADVAQIRAKAMEMVARGEIAAAVELFDDPKAEGPKASALQEAAREVHAAGDLEVTKADAAAKPLIKEGKLAEARAAYSKLKVVGLATLEKRVAAGLKVVADEEQKKTAKLRQKQTQAAETAYGALCDKVDAQLRGFVAEEARRLLSEALRSPALKPLKARIEQDRVMIGLYEEAVSEAVRGAAQLKGRRHTFRMRDGSETSGKVSSVTGKAIEIESRMRGMGSGAMVMRLDVTKLASKEIGDLAFRVMDKKDSKSHLRLAIFTASMGEAETARSYLDRAKALGADTSGVERRWMARLAKKATPVAAAGETAPSQADQARTPATPVPAGKPSAKLAGELKKIQAKASERYKFFMKTKRRWDIVELYLRLEKHREAFGALNQISVTGDPGTVDTVSPALIKAVGAFELQYCLILTKMDETKKVPQLMAEHERKLKQAKASLDPALIPPPVVIRTLDAKKKTVEHFTREKAKADKLIAELAEKPDGRKQWQLAGLYDPFGNHALLPIRWFSALFDTIEKYPDLPQVKSGAAVWSLKRAYEYHKLYEDAIGLTEAMPKLYPEFGPTKSGEHLWFLAHTCGAYGAMQEQMKDKGALQSFQKAVQALQTYQKQFPDAARNKPNPAGTSAAQTYIRIYSNSVERVATAMRRW